MTGNVSSDGNSKAAIMMVASMAGFAVEDLFLKLSTVSLPMGQVLAVNGALGAFIFWVLARKRGETVFTPAALRGMPLLRNGSECLAAALYIYGLATVPLAMVSSIFQATPLVVTAGAALFLGETVGWRRWTAILVGLLGVVVILEPWNSGVSFGALAVVVTVLLVAARDLATRRMPPIFGTMAVSAWGFLASVPAGIALMVISGDSVVIPQGVEFMWLIGALLAGLLAYATLVQSMRIGEVSAVAPFRYSRLVFAILIAAVFLGESLTTSMLIGSAIVVGSGLYAFARGRKRAIKTKPALPQSGAGR